MSRTLSRPALFAALVLMTLACTSSGVQTEAAAPPAQHGSRGQALIDHLTPRRDFTGPPPTKFVWTSAAGADEYAIGLWNESDMMVWRQAGIPQPSVGLPDDIKLEPGTYYWSIVALREGQPIAESGLSAFVVMPSP